MNKGFKTKGYDETESPEFKAKQKYWVILRVSGGLFLIILAILIIISPIKPINTASNWYEVHLFLVYLIVGMIAGVCFSAFAYIFVVGGKLK